MSDNLSRKGAERALHCVLVLLREDHSAKRLESCTLRVVATKLHIESARNILRSAKFNMRSDEYNLHLLKSKQTCMKFQIVLRRFKLHFEGI